MTLPSFNQIPVGFIVVERPSGKVKHVNDMAFQLIECEAGQELTSILPTLNHRRLKRRLEKSLVFSAVIEETPNGVPLEIRASRVEGENGREDLLIINEVAHFSKATSLYRSYAKLVETNKRHRERELSSFPEENPNPVIATSLKGQITYRNPAFEKLVKELDIDSEMELLPKNHAEFIDEVSTSPKKHLSIETTCENRVFGWTYHLVLEETALHIYGTELTAIRQAERDTRAIQQQLSRAQRIQSIGHLAGGIAHDFNNILTAVIGCTEISLDEIGDNPFVQENLEEVLQAAQRARNIIKQILTFSRINEEQSEPVDIRSLIQETSRLLRASMPPGVIFQVDTSALSDLNSTVKGNPNQLHQVIMNLLTNAIHATRSNGGTVSIRASVAPDDDTIIGASSILSVEVEDTGRGIKPETMEHIFEPYFTTRNVGEGSGLGLSVVHGIVADHGGKIEVSTHLGKGTLFTVFLPVMDILVEEQTPIVRKKLPRERSCRILLVDDEPSVARVTSLMLGKFGHEVVVFTKPQLALEAFEEAPDTFDLVITDQTMPIVKGTELTAKILSANQDVDVIICSGFGASMDEEMVKASGAKALMWKPIDFYKLQQLITQLGS